MTPLPTPILLIVWRRPHMLRQLLDAIRPLAPTRLFIACDGPDRSRPGEAEKVAATRALIEAEIDWPCEIQRRYSDFNQGCRNGPSQAISWFFEEVEEGIILEDDCIPHPDFFLFCSELLQRYRLDTRIWSICGSNFQQGNQRGEASYFFSIHGDSWGWATWRRAWTHYHSAQDSWDEFCNTGKLTDIFRMPHEARYWQQMINYLFTTDNPTAWDYQWWLACWMNNGLHAWPNKSLVSNRGWDQDSTHTIGSHPLAALPLEALGPLTHPRFILPNQEADEFSFLFRRDGVGFIAREERAKYGSLYPWIARFRQAQQEGSRSYVLSRLRGLTRSFMHQASQT